MQHGRARYFRTWLCGALVVIAGCATVNNGGVNARVSPELLAASSGASGEIFGSIAYLIGPDQPAYGNASVHFCRVGYAKAEGFFILTNPMLGANAGFDILPENLRGKVFRQKLPAGEYELCWVGMTAAMPSSKFFAPRDKFSIKFNVGVGESLYLGRFVLHGSWTRGMLGNRLPGAGYFQMKNSLEEDLNLLSRKGSQEVLRNVRAANLVSIGTATEFIRTGGEQ